MACKPGRMLSAAACLMLLAGSVAQAGVLAHWSFDESSGTSVADSARPGSPGTLVDTAGSLNAAGVFSSGSTATGGVSLSGNTGGVRVPRIDMATTSFTIAAWIDPTAHTPQAQIFGDWSKRWQMRLFVNSLDTLNPGKLGIDLRADGPLDNNGNILALYTTGTVIDLTPGFQHVAATWDRATKTARLFVDGVQVASTVSNSTTIDAVDDNHANYDIGYKQDGGGEFTGLMDEVWVFNHALSAGELQTLIATNAIPEPTSLAAAIGVIAATCLRRR